MPKGLRKALLQRLENFRKPCGGWDNNPNREHGTAYGSFLALGAYQDLGKLPPKPLRILQSLKHLETPDHAWNNHPNLPVGSTNPTAGAVVLLNNLHLPINTEVGHWLRAQLHPQGGFVAVPGAPMPDLLTTATALHALAALEVRLTEEQTERCLTSSTPSGTPPAVSTAIGPTIISTANIPSTAYCPGALEPKRLTERRGSARATLANIADISVMPQPITVYHGQWMASLRPYLMASIAASEVSIPMMIGRPSDLLNQTSNTPPSSRRW